MRYLQVFHGICLALSLLPAACLAWIHQHDRSRSLSPLSASSKQDHGNEPPPIRFHVDERRRLRGFDSSSLVDSSRRTAMHRALMLCHAAVGTPTRAFAAGGSSRSRTQGYAVQKTEEEWKSMLTPRQYDILRNGGTERQYSSVLEGETRRGTFFCAGCGTALFTSNMKFKSGTGWPSFASALDGVDVEKVNPIQMILGGAELRCKTCGGHLGDVFNDGFIFVGTPAAETGKRFFIDGAAFVFKPDDGSANVVGDQVPTKVEYLYN